MHEDSEWAKDHLPGATHLGRGVIKRDIEETGFLTGLRRLCCTVAVASVGHSRLTICKRWVTPTCFRWTAAIAAGEKGLPIDHGLTMARFFCWFRTRNRGKFLVASVKFASRGERTDTRSVRAALPRGCR